MISNHHWSPLRQNPKAPKFVGSPLQSPYFGTSPYHVRGPEKRNLQDGQESSA